MMENFRKLLKNIISLFYPRLCISCNTYLQQNEVHLCLNCFSHLPETEYHVFPENPLQSIFRGRVDVENIACLLFYKKESQVQRILHSLKYKGNKEIGEFLGRYYGHKLHPFPEYQTIDLILPVPLHRKKLKARGYNQSEWIAKGLSQGLKIPYSNDLLVRTEFTETQTRKSRFNRWENVKEVFQIIDHDRIENKHILICDDVLTTGATIEAIIHRLKACENVKVSVVTLAVTE